LATDFAYSSSSRTGVDEQRRGVDEATSPEKRHRARAYERQEATKTKDVDSQRTKAGTYVRRPRKNVAAPEQDIMRAPLNDTNRKRGPKQVWLPVSVQVVGEGSSESAGKRQRTTVFDRIEDPNAVPEGQRMNSVFNRLEEPSADPARQGRREQ
jgi:hypothetical protein